MDPAPVPYRIEIQGHLGATVLAEFPHMRSQRRDRHTVLVGLLDRSALHGLLAQLEMFGLELLEVRRLRTATSPDDEAGAAGE